MDPWPDGISGGIAPQLTRALMRAALAFFAIACTGALAAPAAASGVCEDARTPAPQRRDDAELILPCAIAESGVLGPACQDAPMYVVTHGGVVLCQVDLAVVLPGSSTPFVTTRPALPAQHHSSSGQEPALPSATPLLRAQTSGDAARAPRAVAALPADVPPVPPWGPS